MSAWFSAVLAPHFAFPRDYTVIDLETSGLSPERNEICVAGHTVVRDGKPVETQETYINWWAEPAADHATIARDLIEVEKGMRAGKKTFLHTKEKLISCGRQPREVFQEYLERFEDMEDRDEVLVSHNGIHFDLPFLTAAFHNWLQVAWKFREDLVFDTGIATKAGQMATVPQPLPEETLYQFFRRVGRTPAKGVFWKLDEYCDKRFKIFEKAGVDKALAHTAGTDSLLTAFLYEELRKLAEADA